MRLRFGNPVINVVGYFFLRNCRHELQGWAPDVELLVARIRDHDKRGVEPVDVVLVQLQKPPYASPEDPNVG